MDSKTVEVGKFSFTCHLAPSSVNINLIGIVSNTTSFMVLCYIQLKVYEKRQLKLVQTEYS